MAFDKSKFGKKTATSTNEESSEEVDSSSSEESESSSDESSEAVKTKGGKMNPLKAWAKSYGK